MKDYIGQLSRNGVALGLADDLVHFWEVRGSASPTRVMLFGTLTARAAFPLAWWQVNLQELFSAFVQDTLLGCGIISIEAHSDGTPHAHFVICIRTDQVQFFEEALRLWNADIGFTKVQEAHNAVHAIGYVIKGLTDGGEALEDRAMLPLLFVGDCWQRHTVDSVPLPTLPVEET